MTTNQVGAVIGVAVLAALLVFGHGHKAAKPAPAPAPAPAASAPVAKAPAKALLPCTKLGSVPESDVAAYAAQYGISAAAVRKLKVCVS